MRGNPSPKTPAQNPSPKRGRRCSATSNRTGEQCNAWACRGATVCVTHGGMAPQVRAAAQRNLAAEKLRGDPVTKRLLDGATPIADPLRALQELGGRARQWLDILEERLPENLRYESTIGTEQIRGEAQLFAGAMRELNMILTNIARLNIDERLVRIEEQTAQMILRALEAGLAEIGIVGRDAARARDVVSRKLRVIEGGKR